MLYLNVQSYSELLLLGCDSTTYHHELIIQEMFTDRRC